MAIDVLKGFLLLCLIFVPLERLFALHQQPVLRHGWQTDTCYFFTGFFIGRATAAVIATAMMVALSHTIPAQFQRAIAAQPIWLQLGEAVLIADLGYYWAHRLLHRVPWLWRFHAVHHGIEVMDWLAAVRVHPIDQIFTKVFQLVPLYLLGFSTPTWTIYALFSAAIAFLIHANLKLRLGWLTWILATPQFHHWHHSRDYQTANTNFAAQLPIVDWLFGTLYLPASQMPDSYGTRDRIPNGYLNQLYYPFQPRRPHAKRINSSTPSKS